MKIAVTSQNFRTVTGHAGRARRFLIFDARPGAEPVEVERLDLPLELAMHEFDGEGKHPLDGVDVILSQSFGEGFAQRVARRGIAAVTTDRSDPMAAVKTYLQRSDAHGHEHQHRHRHGHSHAAGAGGMHRGYRILDAEAGKGDESDA
jgi:predicted Fe-Mo cluster-binding NifX family protein